MCPKFSCRLSHIELLDLSDRRHACVSNAAFKYAAWMSGLPSMLCRGWGFGLGSLLSAAVPKVAAGKGTKADGNLGEANDFYFCKVCRLHAIRDRPPCIPRSQHQAHDLHRGLGC